jgi:hypothetical protein
VIFLDTNICTAAVRGNERKQIGYADVDPQQAYSLDQRAYLMEGIKRKR